ncbi:putative 4-hydroxy-4-methyl-2-oxoglutarate aldolase [Paraferrimonas sedimenticola]|uniref:4-hydroxy-4-methyl-2-oxoglutarate aldolase n=1 Tax=Paraferrimonas sedimenticola TaxID=375674 RepID=A0AA37RX09_9GAMM|nr:putative 4-hydroxy-4-methyl-2-oxoglutarate aldolase [Paraferrimonas sedimenticola]GLP96202.1 putative 4-hydroxy-4-methyl-2-oxoglutarate aldolase [Paraferrimonas sedimenticola]
MTDLLPDLFDDHPNALSWLGSELRNYGGKSSFCGPVVTVRCFEDNSRVKELVNQAGLGRVLLVDGSGSMQRALLGDMLAKAAMENGWAGIVILGCVRDVAQLAQFDIGIQALGACPIKTDKRGLGETQLNLEVSGVEIRPGDWLYADGHGAAISKNKLL